jgi:outer membrane protein OmpA-like peptidoglycan-associated protein
MFKKAIISLLICNSYIVFGQTEEKSEIIISEENLISIINKVREKRDLKNAEKNILVNKKPIIKSTSSTNPNLSSDFEKKSTAELSNLNSKLLQLEYDLKHITSLLENSTSNTIKESELLIINKSAPISNSDNEKLSKLEIELDSLKFASKNKNAVVLDNKVFEKDNESIAKIKSLEKEIETLKTRISNNDKTISVNTLNTITKRDTLYIKSEADLNYSKLLRLYSNFTEKFYFNNNSNVLTDVKKIDGLISTLKSNKNLDVYLKGFASNKGKASYNQELSFKRTEAIKRYMIEKGVHPTRILTQFHGIDYNSDDESDDESDARRVDASFIIRKQ